MVLVYTLRVYLSRDSDSLLPSLTLTTLSRTTLTLGGVGVAAATGEDAHATDHAGLAGGGRNVHKEHSTGENTSCQYQKGTGLDQSPGGLLVSNIRVTPVKVGEGRATTPITP